MKKLLVEPHYLGCIEYFSLLKNAGKVVFEIHDNFQKQTYRNRAYILGSNRIVSLNIPVNYSSHTATKDVRVDYSHRWVKDHLGAVYSSYGKAPFFEFFAQDFKKIWDQKYEFLLDINMKFMMFCFKLLNLDIDVNFSNSFKKHPEMDHEDYRNFIHPKIEFPDRNIYHPTVYSQLFGNSFVANLSIIDLIMCEGPRATEVLSTSFKEN